MTASPGRRVRLTFSHEPSSLPDEPALLAGAAEVDITPPPGLPRAGYSRNAKTGVGFRTRLRARVLHLRSGTTSLAVITTDLLGGSAVVQRMVASAVASSTDVPLAGIFLGATHTHGAPGQYHGTDFYNRFSSNAPGFSPRWTAFVAARLASAVEAAVASRVPAALAWGRAAVPGVARNRSLPAHLLNPSSGLGTSVNPWLEMLRVDSVAGAPLAALAVYSIHGTCVPMASTTYNADLFSYVCSSFSTSFSSSSSPVPQPVFGVLQGTHGDQTPALAGPAGHPEARRIGGLIGEVAVSLYASLASTLTSSVPLAAGFREVPLGTPPLPARPAVGAALVAGAKENETPGVTLVPPFRAGYGKRFSRGPHGAKWVLGSALLQPLVVPPASFPRVLPLHVLRIGEVALAGVPFEVTLESGRRFSAAVSAGFGSPVRAVVSSVADEYAGYCTTSEEYRAQYYEGGHTLYGPRTQEFTAGALESLAGAVDSLGGPGMVQEALPERGFSLRVREYLPGDWVGARRASASPSPGSVLPPGSPPFPGSSPSPPSPGLPPSPESVLPPPSPTSVSSPGSEPSGRAPSSAVGLGEVGEPRRGADTRTGEVFVEWPVSGPAPQHLAWHEPMVRVEWPGGVVLDDGDGSLEIVHVPPRGRLRRRPWIRGAVGEGHRYVVRWYPGAAVADLSSLRLVPLA